MTVDLPLFHFCLARSAELLPRVELGTSSLPRMRSTTELKQHFLLLRRGRSLMSGKRDSNPRPPAWKASALSTELFPQKSNSGFLRESCPHQVENVSIHTPCTRLPRLSATMSQWVRMDSNHRSRRQQIYSLPHLATLEHTLISKFTTQSSLFFRLRESL